MRSLLYRAADKKKLAAAQRISSSSSTIPSISLLVATTASVFRYDLFGSSSSSLSSSSKSPELVHHHHHHQYNNNRSNSNNNNNNGRHYRYGTYNCNGGNGTVVSYVLWSHKGERTITRFRLEVCPANSSFDRSGLAKLCSFLWRIAKETYANQSLPINE